MSNHIFIKGEENITKNSGIYCILNSINNKRYIGSSSKVRYRVYYHINLLRRNGHYNKKLQYSWNKYKEFSFEVQLLEECNKFILINREQFYIDKYNSYFDGLNERPKAENMQGRILSDAHKKKISISLKGHVVTERTREKLRIKHTGKKMSLESRKKLSEIQTGKININSRKIFHLKNLINNNVYIFYGFQEIANFIGCCRTNIYNLIKGKRIFGKPYILIKYGNF